MNIDERLERLADLLQEQAEANIAAAVASAEAVATYRKLHAQEQLKVRHELAGTKFTEAQVDAIVTERTVEALRERLVAEAMHESGRDLLFATRARVDALRTIAASSREAVK